MNENIKRIMEKADMSSLQEIDEQRFELFLHHLINEAVGVVANTSTKAAFTSFDEQVAIGTLVRARQDIKKHFGVK